ncbi:MAG: hypothetical protein ACRDH7_04895 [Actinomycetota bacterium]
MDDLDLLRRMVGEAPVLDETTRARMRASLDERMKKATAPRRSRSRSVVVAILIAAGVGVGTLAAAAGLIGHWSEDQPVAISILPGDHSAGHFEGNHLDISNPNGVIASATEFEATVAEFAPAIRLPDGHDFTMWMQHVEQVADFSSADGSWRRFNQASGMVFVAECQWGQHWVDANHASDPAGMSESIDVLGGIGAWSQSAGIDVDGYTEKLVQQMKDGDAVTLQQFLGVNCGHTGSVIGSPAELDGFAQDILAQALTAAQQFYGVGTTYSGFDVSEAEKTAPILAWISPDMVPVAGPGEANIAVAGGQRLVLTGESESGVIFCIEDQSGVITYGRVAPGGGIDTSVVCEPGDWR